jgi:hypothetical protein
MEMERLNLTEQQVAQLSQVSRELGEERSLQLFLDDLHWAALDISRLMRIKGMPDTNRREKVETRLGELRIKLELIGWLPWMDPKKIQDAKQKALVEMELQAREQLKRKSLKGA